MKRYIKPTLKKINLKFTNKVYFKFNDEDVEWLLTNQINKNFFAQEQMPME